jgi:OOP family OmpA-OmpF porin
MVNKKYLLLAGLCSALALQPAVAQESASSVTDMTYRGENYDFLDSSYYSGKKKMTQYRKYMNHESFFPPKPNNQWEIGVNAGLLNVFGDVTSKMPWNATSFGDAVGYGVTVRKALGYYLSARFQYMHGRATGMDYRMRNADFYPYVVSGSAGNPHPADLYTYGTEIYHNYRTTFNSASIQLVGALNNINFHKAKNSVSIYAFVGAAAMSFNTKLNLKGADGETYESKFQEVYQWQQTSGKANYKDRKEINDKLNEFFDDTYETSAARDAYEGSRGKGTQMTPALVGGLGVQFKLSKVISLSIEDQISMSWRDGLDGVTTWKTLPTADKDILNYASIGLGFNIGSSKKNVAPLWWVNPLDVAYAELSDPRHMKVPPAPIVDTDGDGVADQLDKCPGTPAGEAVDSHGCPLDTDGDGVPDSRDKQLITPTECQPVDADGVGKCPCPDGCGGSVSACSNMSSGALNFSGSSARITPGMQAQLSNLAAQMSANPTCKVVISGAGNTSKVQQQRSWDRVNAVIEYMSEKHGVDRNRFIFKYGEAGADNTVMFRSAMSGEEGPSNVAPPFPNLRKD